MELHVFPNAATANAAAAEALAAWLTASGIRNLMVPGGNTPLDLYARVAVRRLPLRHLQVFTLDEYGGVPEDDPGTCTNLLRRAVADAWGVPLAQYFGLRSDLSAAAGSVTAHEARIAAAGGLDVLILGLGQNGHLGFNEPGSAEDSTARLVELEPVSIEANRAWFKGRHAPCVGITVGLRTLLAAKRVVVLAYGPHKTAAVQAMVEGPRHAQCPASFLQTHPQTHLFLDTAAAVGLGRNR